MCSQTLEIYASLEIVGPLSRRIYSISSFLFISILTVEFLITVQLVPIWGVLSCSRYSARSFRSFLRHLHAVSTPYNCCSTPGDSATAAAEPLGMSSPAGPRSDLHRTLRQQGRSAGLVGFTALGPASSGLPQIHDLF